LKVIVYELYLSSTSLAKAEFELIYSLKDTSL
jgi:hypothetical protein